MALTAGQQACVDTLDRPLAVSAGAGSGKTFTLTRRIVHALECGHLADIDEVLAITFTTKAAGEIKSRVKSALRGAGMTEQALKVDNAWISTIHGACSRILRAHALELGIDPQFDIIDESRSRAMLENALEAVIGGHDDMVNGLVGIDAGRIDALFAEFKARSQGGSLGVSVEGVVRELVTIAQASPDGMGAVVCPPAPAGLEKLLVQLCDAARDACTLAGEVKPGKTRDEFLMLTQEAIASVDRALADGAALTYLEALTVANGFPVPGKRFGKGTAYQELLPELVTRYQGVAAELCAGIVRPHLETLVEIASLVSSIFSKSKREAGVLDNSDLLTFTARALRDRPEIARCYADRFKMVMIDEFQDTDQLQVDMISKLSGKAGERLCVVGDAQQSIYRFRGADVSVYRKHLAAVRAENPDGVIELPDNFRSHADILLLCDRIFPQGKYGDDYMSLHAGRDEARVKRPFAGPGPRVSVQVTSFPYRGVATEEALRVQASRIAQRFAAYRRAGHAPGEMVVLLGAMSKADTYAAAIRAAGLPCVVAGGSIFNRAPEVALMVRLAEALVNPKGSKALFEVASSELFALSADDLIELSTGTDANRGILKRRRFDEGFRNLERMTASGKAPSPALACAAALMNRASEQVGRVPLSEVMQGIVVDSGWLARLEAAGAEGLARAGNVYKVIRHAADLEAASGLGPAGVAARLAADVEAAREAPGALSAGEGDSVRIMTVHASKGLEFPIVAIAEFGDDSLRASALQSCTIAGRTYVSLDGGSTLSGLREGSSNLVKKARDYSPFDEDYAADDLARIVARTESPAAFRAAIHGFEEAGEAAEARRLLYVAITRAKEAVVISMRGRTKNGDPSGLSNSVWEDVQTALAGQGAFFEDGVTGYDFGGSDPACVSRVTLDPDSVAAFEKRGLAGLEVLAASGEAGVAAGADAAVVTGGADAAAGVGVAGSEGALGTDAAEGATPGADAGGPSCRIDIPAVPPYLPERGKPWHPGREGVFSYSSLAGEHGALVDTSQAFWADEALSDGDFAADSLGCDEAPIARLAADADAATTFGQAFHRLAQASVLSWAPGQRLAAPASRRRAIAAAVGLAAAEDVARLNAALDRWFASDLAARVAGFTRLRAEVPFMVDMGDHGLGEAFLEGEIDLLAVSDKPGTRAHPEGFALVVDYKTGGHATESAAWLHEKHLLQATCYAYAVLQQGYERVECAFVRVEQVAPTAAGAAAASAAHAGAFPQTSGHADPVAGQPQVISYEFVASDLPEIGRAIMKARAASLANGAAKDPAPRRQAGGEAGDSMCGEATPASDVREDHS